MPGEERLPRCQHDLRGRCRPHRGRAAPAHFGRAVVGLHDRVDQSVDRAPVVEHRHDRDQRVPVRLLDGDTGGDQPAFDGQSVTAVEHHHQLRRVDPADGEVSRVERGHARVRESTTGVRDKVQQLVQAGAPGVARQQSAGRVDARQNRPGGTGRRTGVEGAVQPSRVEPLGAGRDDRRLRVGGQRLVGAGDHEVGARLQCMRRVGRVEAEVRAPCLVDDHRNVSPMGRVDDRCEVGQRAHVARLDQEDPDRFGMVGQRCRHSVGRDADGQSGPCVDLGGKPDRLQPGEDQPGQRAAMRGAADQHGVAGTPDRERSDLVDVRRPVRRVPAPVGAPQPGAGPFGTGQDVARRLHRRRVPHRAARRCPPPGRVSARACRPGACAQES